MEIAARLRNQNGFILAQTSKFLEAKEELAEASHLAEECALEALLAEIQINRGTLFFYLTDYHSMEQCARDSLAIAQRNGLLGVEASACAGLGKCFMVRQRWDEAIEWYGRALQIFAADGSSFYADWMRSELGCCYLGLGDDEQAMQLFQEALKHSKEAGALSSQHTDLANMGCVYLRRGEYSTAISHFQKALEIARGLGDQISTAKWLRNLSLTHKCMGNAMLAMTYELEAEHVNQTVAQARVAAR